MINSNAKCTQLVTLELTKDSQNFHLCYLWKENQKYKKLHLIFWRCVKILNSIWLLTISYWKAGSHARISSHKKTQSNMPSTLISLSFKRDVQCLKCSRVYHCIWFQSLREPKVSASRWELFLWNPSIIATVNPYIKIQKRSLQKKLTSMHSSARWGSNSPKNLVTLIQLWFAKLMICQLYRRNFSYLESNWLVKLRRGKLIMLQSLKCRLYHQFHQLKVMRISKVLTESKYLEIQSNLLQLIWYNQLSL